MSKNNEGKQLKKCPFLGVFCDDEALKNCAIAISMRRATPQGVFTKETCIFMALGEMISEINAKTPMPQQPDNQKIILPFGGRG